MSGLQDSLYWVVGFLVLSSLGTLVTVLTLLFRGVWWASKIDARVDGVEKDVDVAFVRIRELEGAKK